MICSVLSADPKTLLRVALSCHSYSHIALPTLYSTLEHFPGDDIVDWLAEKPETAETRIRKWSSLWKSIAMSAKTPRTTLCCLSSCPQSPRLVFFNERTIRPEMVFGRGTNSGIQIRTKRLFAFLHSSNPPAKNWSIGRYYLWCQSDGRLLSRSHCSRSS